MRLREREKRAGKNIKRLEKEEVKPVYVREGRCEDTSRGEWEAVCSQRGRGRGSHDEGSCNDVGEMEVTDSLHLSTLSGSRKYSVIVR